MWLVQETRSTFSTNQIQQHNHNFVAHVFPRKEWFPWLSWVEFLLAPCKISFALIGCCDYFGSSVCSMISMKIAFSILSFYLILLFNFHYYSTCTLFQMNSQWIFWSTTTQRQRKLIIIWGVIVQCFREFKVKANYNDHYSQVFSPAISMKTL